MHVIIVIDIIIITITISTIHIYIYIHSGLLGTVSDLGHALAADGSLNAKRLCRQTRDQTKGVGVCSILT